MLSLTDTECSKMRLRNAYCRHLGSFCHRQKRRQNAIATEETTIRLIKQKSLLVYETSVRSLRRDIRSQERQHGAHPE